MKNTNTQYNIALAALIGVTAGVLLGTSTVANPDMLALFYPNAAKFLIEGEGRPKTVESIRTGRVINDVDVVNRHLKPLPPRDASWLNRVMDRRAERTFNHRYDYHSASEDPACTQYVHGGPRWVRCKLQAGEFADPDSTNYSELKSRRLLP